MSAQRRSSRREASKAAEVLRDPGASGREKSLAASVLSQVRANAQTSPEMADMAAKVLDNPNASATAQSLAGSVLTQTPRSPR